MIELRKRLTTPRASLRVVLLIASILAALVWAHSMGEGHPMPEDSPTDLEMAMCLAILGGGALAALAGPATRLVRLRPRRSILRLGRSLTVVAFARARQRPPPRAGPTALQVFLC